MIETIKNAWKIPDLRRKLLFVVFALVIFRFGYAIYVPYVDTEALADVFKQYSDTLLGYFNTLSGGGFSQASIFALSVYPYINSSIIMQLLQVAIPALERMVKDGGEEGRQKTGFHHPLCDHRPVFAHGLDLLYYAAHQRRSDPHRPVECHRYHPDLHSRFQLHHVAG